MVQDYIRENMPNGGYQIVSKRLESQGVTIKGIGVHVEVKTLKNNTDTSIIGECVKFLRECKIPLDSYCEDFIRKEDKE